MLFGPLISLPIKEEEEVWDLFFPLMPTLSWNLVLLAWEKPEVETLYPHPHPDPPQHVPKSRPWCLCPYGDISNPPPPDVSSMSPPNYTTMNVTC